MAAATPSTQFLHLANVLRLLCLRSDADDIILELLGRFALDRIYADSDREKFQQLVSTLLSQLNAVIYIQRLSLPSEREQIDEYVGFLANWETISRSIEFVLQLVIDGHETLFNVHQQLDVQLADLVSTALRVLSFHPKGLPDIQDQKHRFARIHGLLDKLHDRFPGPRPCLLLICRDIANALPKYPLPECLSDRYVTTIVEQDGPSVNWLTQFLALRDITQFVVGASIQYAVTDETEDVYLPASCAKTRNAILASLDKIRIPSNYPKLELLSMFSEAFRTILPDTPPITGFRNHSGLLGDVNGVEAIKSFCLSLTNRQIIHRSSDGPLMRAIAEVNRRITLLDDPNETSDGTFPRAYALNCKSCHLAGDTQLRVLEHLEFPSPTEGSEIGLPPNTKCVQCGQIVTLAREIPLIRETWELLNDIDYNADPPSEERHFCPPYQLFPSKMPSDQSSSLQAPQSPNIIPSPVTQGRSPITINNVSPISPESRHIFDDPFGQDHTLGSITEIVSPDVDISRPHFTHTSDQSSQNGSETYRKPPRSEKMSNIHRTTSNHSVSPPRPGTSGRPFIPGKKLSRWLGSKREHRATASGDASSHSSGSMENQRPEEICLKSLTSAARSQGKGKGSKLMNVSLSQNSTNALFWMPSTIQVWDVGVSPAAVTRVIPTEGSCLVAAVTKRYLAYMVGSKDQKLTLRIVNLSLPTAAPLEYQMPSSQWCKSIAICPRETYVAVGFENATVRFFKAGMFEPQREFRLHNRYHTTTECENCPPVDTLSFSTDGETLIASTRNLKGVIQTFIRRASTFTFQELVNCHYPIPLHESEDGGISSVIYRPGVGGEDDLVCITTWTQSGIPILLSPKTGHRVEIKADSSSHQRRLGTRVQCGAFSLSGKQLGLVNDKGHLYLVSNLNSSVMEARKLATTRELTARSSFFSMSFMILQGDESIVLAWADHGETMMAEVQAHASDLTELPGDLGAGGYNSFSDRSGDSHHNNGRIASRPAARNPHSTNPPPNIRVGLELTYQVVDGSIVTLLVSGAKRGKHYGLAARSSDDNAYSRKVAEAFGYSEAELANTPKDANLGLSCGNPLALANLKEGECVVDLGCGAGFDVFLAAKAVGATGKVIGDMLERANKNKENAKVENVSFVDSQITAINLSNSVANCIISNCVVNLVPESDKQLVFNEMFRLLKPGGRVAISDILAKKPLPTNIRESVALYVGCIAGASQVEDYDKYLREAGFNEILIIDANSDLNVYTSAKTDGESGGCCSAQKKPDCCSGEGNQTSDIQNVDFNEWAGSFKIYAVKS
ncbi:WD40 repeat protein [Arthroderma uncinatum]|uniref:WD40 repeat protein n=1 Tax=Arthroderma uncinatum TaxID=74035 RepID=UPI00144A5069|nr:WD40 repeat protein [Arthroderma uncinatum]KAF3479877.1 WD40 repeat protein [Arthroderma uncinatum]